VKKPFPVDPFRQPPQHIEIGLPISTAGAGGSIDLSAYAAIEVIAVRLRFQASAAVGNRFPMFQLIGKSGFAFFSQSGNAMAAGSTWIISGHNRMGSSAAGVSVIRVELQSPVMVSPVQFIYTPLSMDLADVLDQGVLWAKAWY